MGLDPGSEKKPISDSGSRGQKGTGSRIRNTARGQESVEKYLHAEALRLGLELARLVEG